MPGQGGTLMARRVMLRVLKRAAAQWLAHNAPSRGAAIAYYTIFSMVPVLILIIALAGLLFGRAAAQGAILDEFRSTMGTDVALALENILKSASRPANNVFS